MRWLVLPLLYISLLVGGLAAPIYAAIVLLDIAAPNPISAAEAEPAASVQAETVSAESQAAPQRPVWVAPTRQYSYTLPPLPETQPATEREARTKKDASAKKEKASKKRERERKPTQEARPRRSVEPQAEQAYAAEIVPERVINRD
jgi:outer membrane biosynthesis protein TonB